MKNTEIMNNFFKQKNVAHRYLSPLIILILATFSLQAIADLSQNLKDLSISQAVEIALKDNPSYAQVQSRYRALLDIPSQAGALPDPIIILNGLNLPASDLNSTQEGMTQLQLGVSQAFPFPGKLSLREKSAEYEAAAGLESVFELRLKLKQQVTSSWWELYYLERSLEVINANLNLLRQFVKIADTKYKVGDGLQQDVLLAQLELSKLLEQEIRVKSLRRIEMATLNTLMGENANTKIALSQSIKKNLVGIATTDALLTQTNEKNPSLKKDKNLISAAQSRLSLAEKEYYPDFKVSLVYGDRQGNNPVAAGGGDREDAISVLFNMSFPLYAGSKQDKGVSQRSNELLERKYSRQDTYNALYSRIVSLSSDYFKSRELFKLFDTGIIPQAQQTVDSMLSGYKVSEVDFLNLVRSQITLLNYQIRYWRVLTQGKQFLAKIDEITAGDNLYE